MQMDGQIGFLLKSIGMEIPVIQAPMAGVDTPALAAAVIKSGGLGSLACALRTPDDIRAACRQIRQETAGPINLNFFCHSVPEYSDAARRRWLQRLLPYYHGFGLDPQSLLPSAVRAPFNENFCEVIEDINPRVVSFHFGLPSHELLTRVKKMGAVIFSSATTVAEAVWLEQNGCDVVIAQGAEAGGHRAMFLFADIENQPDMFPLLGEVLAHIKIPVIAAGGITNVRDVHAALAMGAAAVQIGTGYLFCPEANVSPLYRDALCSFDETVITNVFSGRPARGIKNRFINEIGPMAREAPDFPHAAELVNPLRQASEKSGNIDFMQMWSGSKRVPHDMDAQTYTRFLYEGVTGSGA